MTTILISVVVVLGAVAVLNLLLTVGVIRRLREHTERLSALNGGAAPGILPVGQRVGDFVATTADGELVTRDGLSGQVLVGVFSPGCGACEERLPDFLTRAQEFPGGRSQVLAVVAGEPVEASRYRERLSAVGRVVVEAAQGGQLAAALQVSAFPAFALIDAEGVVVASGLAPSDLPLTSPVAA